MKYLFTAIAMASLCGAALAQEESVEFDRLTLTLRAWRADFSAETSLVKDFKGDKLDLDDELAIDDDYSPEVILRFQPLPRHAFELGYNHMAFEGDEIVAQGVVVDDSFIPLFAHLEVDSEMHFLRLDWRRSFFEQDARFNVETILGVQGFDISGEYEAYLPTGAWRKAFPDWARELRRDLGRLLPDELDFLNVDLYYHDQEDITAGLPIVGLGLKFRPIDRLTIAAQAYGMYAGDYGNFFNAEASLSYRLTKWLDLEGGYRYWNIEYEDDDDDYQVVMNGAFVGGRVSF
ncbi:MAG: hypothetical protein IT365_08845 [Candidatus Hydrogenedentes bacterium]|nr:hypothetical protein [Candidatus Hydrogenedentota bacterium]